MLATGVTATSTAGICGGGTSASGGVLPEALKDKQLLLCLCKFAFDVCGILCLNKRTRRRAFCRDCGFELAILHGVVVVELSKLLADIGVERLNALLSVTATGGNCRLNVSLPELILIRGIGNCVTDFALSELVLIRGVGDCRVGVSKGLEEVGTEVAERVSDAIDSLGGVVCTCLELCDVGRVCDSKVSTERANSGRATAAISSSISESSEAAAPSAKSEEKQDNPSPPAAAEAAAIAPVGVVSVVVQKCHCLPAVKARIPGGIDVVNRNCFHDFTSFFSVFFLFKSECKRREFRSSATITGRNIKTDFRKLKYWKIGERMRTLKT